MFSILLSCSQSNVVQIWLEKLIYFDFLSFYIIRNSKVLLQLWEKSWRRKLDFYCSSTITSIKKPGIYNFFMSKMMVSKFQISMWCSYVEYTASCLRWWSPNFRFLCGTVMLSIMLRSIHLNEVRIII